MARSDHDLPVAVAFHVLVDDAKQTDITAEEQRLKSEKELRKKLFAHQHPGSVTTTEAFLPEERENEKLKGAINKELDAQEAARRAAQEKADAASDEGEFPAPVITTT